MVVRAFDPVIWPASVNGRGRAIGPVAASGAVVLGALGVSGGDERAPTPPATTASATTPVPAAPPPPGPEARSKMSDRRRFLGTAALAGTAAWVAPVILSIPTPAAAASGCTGEPTYLGFAEQVDIGVINATITNTFTVAGVPTVGNAVEHIAFGIADHIIGMPLSYFTDPPGWSLLGYYDSDVTVPGIAAVGSAANWSERVRVWRRTGPLAASYDFTVTYTGSDTYIPQARVVVAAFTNTAAFANNPGEFAMEGNGVVVPNPPPTSSPVYVPAISTSNSQTVALGFAGAGNVNNSQVLTVPPGYALSATANSGNGFPPLWLFTRTTGAGGLPATSGTITPGGMTVGGQITLTCS